jgi:hypothetical protein
MECGREQGKRRGAKTSCRPSDTGAPSPSIQTSVNAVRVGWRPVSA